MRFSHSRRRKITHLDLVPLIDLFLNILVFFVVTTTFASDSMFFVDLPEASTAEGVSQRRLVAIDISTAGEIALDRKTVSLEELATGLERIPEGERAAVPVVIRADRGALHGRVVAVLDLIRKENFRNVGVATRSSDSNEK